MGLSYRDGREKQGGGGVGGEGAGRGDNDALIRLLSSAWVVYGKGIWLSMMLTTSLLNPCYAQAAGGTCISLSSSKLCSAFNNSYVSTSSSTTFPFMLFVSNTSTFDTKFAEYIQNEYVQSKYQNILGCTGLDFTNTSSLYARFTTSVLCNSLVQSAGSECNKQHSQMTPLCADTCAQFAISEQIISSDPATCNTTRADRTNQIRSDFTICALPADSLSGDCISGEHNEDQNCGYGPNLPGLCLYCASSSPNATDTCCYRSDLSKCGSVRLPPTTSLPPLFTSSATPSSHSNTTASQSGSNSDHKILSGGGIAGVIIGSLLIIALIILVALFFSRRRKSKAAHVFNQPSPRRSASQSRIAAAFTPVRSAATNGIQRHDGYEVLPNSRIARMSALETTDQPSDPGTSPQSQMEHVNRGAVMFNSSSSSNHNPGDTPESNQQRAAYIPGSEPRPLQPPPRGTRNTSLSSASALDHFPSSPSSDVGVDVSSPTYDSSQQSEQLSSFKDYYSKDDVHPNDKVAVLWAYAPRAADEFELERGDVLKVVGIWDDGWATGIRMNERAEDFVRDRNVRDSNVSSSQTSRGNREKKELSPINGEIKAFPLVCVCLPEHWQKIIDQENRTSQIVSMNINSAYGKPPESELRNFPPDNGTSQATDNERSATSKRSGGFQDDSQTEKR